MLGDVAPVVVLTTAGCGHVWMVVSSSLSMSMMRPSMLSPSRRYRFRALMDRVSDLYLGHYRDS